MVLWLGSASGTAGASPMASARRSLVFIPVFGWLDVFRSRPRATVLIGATGVRSTGLLVIASILLIVGMLDRLLSVRLLHSVLPFCRQCRQTPPQAFRSLGATQPFLKNINL